MVALASVCGLPPPHDELRLSCLIDIATHCHRQRRGAAGSRAVEEDAARVHSREGKTPLVRSNLQRCEASGKKEERKKERTNESKSERTNERKGQPRGAGFRRYTCLSVAAEWVVVEADGCWSCVCELLVLGMLADEDGVRIVSAGPGRHVHPSH